MVMEGIFKKQSNDTSGGTKDYNNLTNKPTVNDIELTGNKTSEELGIAGASLYDIKTLAQAIANKGWACISQDKTIAKSAISTLSQDLQEKFDGVDKQESWVQKWNNDNKCNFVYHQGFYYYLFGGNRNWSLRLYKTSSLDVEGTDISGEIVGRSGITKLLLYDKYLLCFNNASDGGLFFVYNLDTNTFHNFGNSINVDGIISIVDNKLICKKWNGWVLDLSYIWNEDLIDHIVNFDGESGLWLADFRNGNTYYTVNNYSLYYGSSIDNCVNSLNIEGCVVYNDAEAVLALDMFSRKSYRVVNGTIVSQADTNLRALEDHYEWQPPIKIGNRYFACRPNNANIYTSTDYIVWSKYSDSALPDLTDTNKWISNVNNIFVILAQVGDNSFDVYMPEDVATEYTDIINGINQVYYYNSTYKMKFAKDTTNKSAIVNALGYWNYFYIGENSITLPQNNNLWSWLYVGDDYVETEIPAGNATRLLPQSEVITDTTSTSISFSSTDKLKTNADYQLGTLTALSFGANSVDDSQLETTIRFTAGASFAFSYTNAGVKINGELPTFEEDGEYIILIVNKTIFVSDKIVAGV